MIGEPSRTEGDLTRELSESIFLLKKSSSSSTASIQVDFSPLASREEPSQCSAKTLPAFNPDGNYFTPSFVLQIDQERYKENEDLYLKIHNRKVSQISEQKAELFVPRPSKNNSYCCICRVPFEDYLTHINTPKHHFLTNKSEYNQSIKMLCSQVGPAKKANEVVKKKRGRPAKTKLIQKICLKGDPVREKVEALPISINP